MNTIIKIVVLSVTLLMSSSLFAQDFQGIATYKTKRKVDIKLDSSKVNTEIQKQMMELLKKQFEKTFILTFNAAESIYKEEETLAAPQVGGNNGFMVMAIGGGSDVLYKNTKEDRYTSQRDLMGKQFLIRDAIQKHDWELGSETKNIGEYTCYKATITRQIEVPETGISVNGDNPLKDENMVTKTQVITAWYTLQIPVNHGPQNYQGLPGLILEVNDGEETIVCSKIVINPEDRIQIKEPTKGKEVDQVSFDKIREKKQKELQEQFSPRDGREGQTFEIRIGG